jgi:hypothetical protein
LIHFHQSHYRNFKANYCEYVLHHLRGEFPGQLDVRADRLCSSAQETVFRSEKTCVPTRLARTHVT